MGYQEEKNRRNLALLQALGFVEASEEPSSEPEGKVNFDGGARETAPLPSDPLWEHNDFVLGLFQEYRGGGGGEW